MDDEARHELDRATLVAELDARWPDATGDARAVTDETHRLALVHPEYDGFISLEVTARCDLDGVFVLPDEELADLVTSHHRTGWLLRGQRLPIDLELHPGRIAPPAVSGLLELVDVEGEPVAPPVRLTLATDPSLDCVLAGAIDGPFADRLAFESAVADLASGRGTAKRLAKRLQQLESGAEDPGWSRMPWRRG
ncbi:MAG: hypothetical protein JWM86_56 [Thermoleophilia bacterium]|nr:hypothetical protein [Thermoleophilia bacterium]